VPYIDAWAGDDKWSEYWGEYVTSTVSPGELPYGTLPVVDLTTLQILYGSRTTSYRFELLAHQSDGTDTLAGTLDGVLPQGTLAWQWNQAVKGSGTLNVADLDVAQPGMTRIRDVNLTTVRIRPVLVIDGLPEIPLGVFLVTAAPETWSDEGRIFQLELHDRCTVLDQDQLSESFTAVTTSTVMAQIATVIASAGEAFTPDGSETRSLTAPMTWPVGTTKLQVVNDLLGALNYNALTITGHGDWQVTPYVRPAARPTTYGLLNGVTRELVDGAASIYQPDWNRDRDVFGVPNKVVTVEAATGTGAPAVGVYTNTSPTSPFSYAARGRWIVATVQGIQVPTSTVATDFLNAVAQATLIALSSPAATVTVKHLPLPLAVGDVLTFASTPAGINSRHVVVGLTLELTATGLMQSTLQEVVDL
jgi:hypothetical protein